MTDCCSENGPLISGARRTLTLQGVVLSGAQMLRDLAQGESNVLLRIGYANVLPSTKKLWLREREHSVICSCVWPRGHEHWIH
eukprot:5610256-Pyramimonas_sp.AAC.1